MQSSHHDEMQQFVDSCKARLHKLLERLNWTEEGVLKNFNSNSLAASSQAVPQKSKQAATAITSTYPEGCITNNSVVLKTPDLQDLLGDFEGKLEAPQNFNDLQANFTRDQKLQIYEHTIRNTKKLNNNTVAEVPDGEVSLAEIVAAARREAKRKKRKFRKTKPTRIEEVRALVQLQMQAMQTFIANHEGINIKQEIDSDIQEEREDRQHVYKGTSSWKKDDNRNKYSGTSSRYQENRGNNYGKRGNIDSDNHWDAQTKYRGSIRHYGERHERKYNQSPECSRNNSHKEYAKERETAKEYPKQRETAKEYTSYARKRSTSPESHKYHKKDYHKRHESYDKSSRERGNRRSRSPVSHKYASESKRDKDYYRRRSKSPTSSHCKNEKIYKESYQSKGHKDRTNKKHHRERSRSRERHRHKKKSRSRSKSRRRYRKDEYSPGDIKHEFKSQCIKLEFKTENIKLEVKSEKDYE